LLKITAWQYKNIAIAAWYERTGYENSDISTLELDIGTGFQPSNFNFSPIPGSSGEIALSDITDTAVTLSWNPAINVDTALTEPQYKVYYSTSPDFDSVDKIKANGTAANQYTRSIHSFTVTGLSQQTYSFNILAIDDIRIFTRMLTENEIKAIYASEKPQ
jgi:hypothetical protein